MLSIMSFQRNGNVTHLMTGLTFTIRNSSAWTTRGVVVWKSSRALSSSILSCCRRHLTPFVGYDDYCCRENIQTIRRKSTTVSTTTASKTAEELKNCMKVEHPAYEVLSRDIVHEYEAYSTLFRHKKSGAELLSVTTDDDNKVFGITFRTPPEDFTGIPHILEHAVMCGSIKHTSKKPFTYLLQGSLQTYMNAMTTEDRTSYVLASQNVKDFYNLISFYTDSVFSPRAITDPMILAQEGWHFELERKEQPLTINGVVLNEVKGDYSQPDERIKQITQQSLFPDNAYKFDFGGDPRAIPNLSFEQFVAFYKRCYHPSNARIFFWGDDDTQTRLNFMNECLKEFTILPGSAEAKEHTKIKWQPKKYANPVNEVQRYPASADQSNEHMLMVAWLLNDQPMTPTEEMTLLVLDHLLTGTYSSILSKALFESGLGDSIIGGGLSDELLQATYSIGLEGIQLSNIRATEKLIVETLEKVSKEGFTDDAIASSLNTIEFQLREFDFDPDDSSSPKGLRFMDLSMKKWLYEKSPTDSLKFEKPLAELRAKIAESGSKVFKDIVKELLVCNTHRTTVVLRPSNKLEEELLTKEKQRLAEIKSRLSEKELERVIKLTKDLKELQGAEDPPEARATIPSLKLSDLKREVQEFPIVVTENEANTGVTVVRHEMSSTSGIAYCVLYVDLSKLSFEDDVALLPLFVRVLGGSGSEKFDPVQVSQKIGSYTGGVNVELLTSVVYPDDLDQDVSSSGEHMITKLVVRAKATCENIDEMFSIIKFVLTDTKIDNKVPVKEILKETRSRLKSEIQENGDEIVHKRMLARYRPTAFVDEMLNGIAALDTAKSLAKTAGKERMALILNSKDVENEHVGDDPTLLARLEKIRATILDELSCRSGMILDITGDRKVLDSIHPSVEKFLKDLPGKPDGETLQNFSKEVHPWIPAAKKLMAKVVPIVDEGFIIPTQVSYVGKAGLLYDEGEWIPGHAAVVARFIHTKYLWDHVRVMGGAYGSVCNFSEFSGFCSLVSDRDPNLEKTIDVFDAAADAILQYAEQMENNPDMLERAIIGTIGDLDRVRNNEEKGDTAFKRWLINETAEYRQKYRDEILETKPSHFREFARRLKNMKNPSIAVLSSQAMFEEATKAGRKMTLKKAF